MAYGRQTRYIEIDGEEYAIHYKVLEYINKLEGRDEEE